MIYIHLLANELTLRLVPLKPGFFTTPEAFASCVIITSAEFGPTGNDSPVIEVGVRVLLVPFTLTILD